MLAVGFFFSAIAEETSNKHLDWFSLSSHQLHSFPLSKTQLNILSPRENLHTVLEVMEQKARRAHTQTVTEMNY